MNTNLKILWIAHYTIKEVVFELSLLTLTSQLSSGHQMLFSIVTLDGTLLILGYYTISCHRKVISSYEIRPHQKEQRLSVLSLQEPTLYIIETCCPYPKSRGLANSDNYKVQETFATIGQFSVLCDSIFKIILYPRGMISVLGKNIFYCQTIGQNG